MFSQALSKEVGEWRRREEANNCLRRRFEESRQELERVMKKAGSCLKETGEAEELLKKHSVRSKLTSRAQIPFSCGGIDRWKVSVIIAAFEMRDDTAG